MSHPYRDAVVLVTGASSGIGRELARQMAPDCRAIALVARRADRLEALALELREQHGREVFVRATDLCDRADTAAMCDEVEAALGPVDVLVNNAGFGDISALDLASWDRQQRMIDLNVSALTFLTHRFYPGMVERGRGGVLMISSGFGLQFLPGFGVYVATKHFVTGLTECLHVEAAGLGVAVTQVCPGPVDTEFEENAGNFIGRSPPAMVRISASHCARSALAGFRKGRALVVPGLVMKLVMLSGAWTPRWILRLVYRPFASAMRSRQLAARAS